MRIRILRNPDDMTLANLEITVHEGDEVDLPDHVAQELVKLRVAEPVDE